MPRVRSTKGGYQPPAHPAPVSGPGRLSRRTDSAATQPIRVASGQPYGARQAAIASQQAAPLPAAAPVRRNAPAGAPAAPAPGLPSVFRPTDRPREPITAGIPFGPGASGASPSPLDDAELILAAAWRVLPAQEIARLRMSHNLARGGSQRG